MLFNVDNFKSIQETEPKDYVESWKRLEMPDLRSTLRPDSDWVEERVVQEPALFLQEEAARSGVQLLTEVEHTDVPGVVVVYQCTTENI